MSLIYCTFENSGKPPFSW